MRILVAPDAFKESLTAAQASGAIALGWNRSAPDDELDLCPMSDGGPGFVDTLHAALGGTLLAETVSGPSGIPAPAAVLLVGDTAYVESAHACGLHLIPAASRNPAVSTSYGLGELILGAVRAGARRIVVGLGGSGTNDAGAGMLAALGASADAPLDQGGLALKSVTHADLTAARAALDGIELVAATDVDSPLLGPTGTTKTFAAQKGADESAIMALEGALLAFSEALGRRPSDGKDPAVALGAGAAGGIAYGLFQLGARRSAGIGTVMDAVGFADRVAGCDLVVTGEGKFDWQSMRGKVATGVAGAALAQARPCVVVAGQVMVGRREYTAIGVTSAYSVSEMTGSIASSLERPADTLANAAERVARTWSH